MVNRLKYVHFDTEHLVYFVYTFNLRFYQHVSMAFVTLNAYTVESAYKNTGYNNTPHVRPVLIITILGMYGL